MQLSKITRHGSFECTYLPLDTVSFALVKQKVTPASPACNYVQIIRAIFNQFCHLPETGAGPNGGCSN